MTGPRRVICIAVGFAVVAFVGVSAVGSAAGSVSCVVAREAILTGDPTVIHDAAEIAVSLRELAADPSAPPVARDYARIWLSRDTAHGRASAANVILAACR